MQVRSGRRSATTEFEHLARQLLFQLHPGGCAKNYFKSGAGADAYRGGVKPDFVLPDGRWIDFKLRVSFREKNDVPWRPSALYSSLRKYIDHPANPNQSLIIVYRHLHGSISDVVFPIRRGEKVLLATPGEFERRLAFVDVRRLLPRLTPRARQLLEPRILAL